MALTLTIASQNFLPQYVNGSAKITKQTDSKANTMQMRIKRTGVQLEPYEGQELVFKDGARFLHAGYISKVEKEERGKGSVFYYNLEVSNYVYIFNNKLIAKNYQAMSLRDIVLDVLDRAVSPSYGILDTGVQEGPIIPTVTFNHISVRKAFEKLAKLTGYVWWVDDAKVLHFIEQTSEAAPESITDTSNNYESISISYDVSQVRNTIVIQGGGEITDLPYTQTFVADGEAREWILMEKPKQTVSITIGGAAQTFDADYLNPDNSSQVLVSYQEKRVKLSSNEATPTAGTLIEVVYYYEEPIITKLIDQDSIDYMKALEGGDGVHDYAINDNTISSLAEARDRALQEFEEWAYPLIDGMFVTRTSLLGAGHYFEPGQILSVNLPTWGISTTRQYLIRQVLIDIYEQNGTPEYRYTVHFGGKLLGIIDVLEQVIQPAEIEAVGEDVQTIHAMQETINIGESVTKTKVTPPYKYGPSGVGTVGKWNLSEWA